MNVPRIKKATPSELPGNIIVEFENGIIKQLDIAPYLEAFPQFVSLRNKQSFDSVHVDCGGFAIAWNDNIDIDRYDAWELGVDVNN